jgi:hypothetical protein
MSDLATTLKQVKGLAQAGDPIAQAVIQSHCCSAKEPVEAASAGAGDVALAADSTTTGTIIWFGGTVDTPDNVWVVVPGGGTVQLKP